MSPIRNPTPVQIFDESVAQGHTTALDFRGAGVAVVITSGTAVVSIPGGAGVEGVSVADEGVGQGQASAFDFRGAGVVATVAAGVATVSIPGGTGTEGVSISDEGVGQGQASAIDFRGAGVAATVAAGVATVSINGGGGGVTTMKVSADVSVATVANASITGLSFAVVSNTDYAFRYHLVIQTTASTVGYKVGIDNVPAGANVEYQVHYQTVANAAVGADVTQRHDVASMAMAAITSTPVASNVNQLITLEGTLMVSATGGSLDVAMGLDASGAGVGLRVKKGSWGFRF